MTRRLTVLCLLLLLSPADYAQADVKVGSDPFKPNVNIKVRKQKPPSHHNRHHGGNSNGGQELHSACRYNGLLIICPDPVDAGSVGAVFTPGMAREAVEDIPMPALELHVQPAGPTLINVDTIFWAEPRAFSTSIDLLGHEIEVEATPESFTWVHGDGSSQTTSEAGAPYPRRDITHRYFRAERVSAHVDTTYSVRYSIDGDGWDDLGQPLTAQGPSTTVDVHEAAPVLVH